MFFIPKILDGLIIQQGVDSLCGGLAVHFVHLAAELNTPFRNADGPGNVTPDGNKRDKSEPYVEKAPHDRANKKYLQQGGDDVKQHKI